MFSSIGFRRIGMHGEEAEIGNHINGHGYMSGGEFPHPPFPQALRKNPQMNEIEEMEEYIRGGI